MPFEEYWTGKGIDFDSLWEDYDGGGGYIAKVESSELYLLRLTFSAHPKSLPLFDHEAIYKSVKGSFHDIKRECLSPHDYDSAAPIFLYRIDRGSAVYEFLAEIKPLFPYIAAVAAAGMWYRGAIRKDQDYDETCWKFIKEQFPRATDEDYAAYIKASTTWGRRKVLQRLIRLGLHRVEMSKYPVTVETPAESQEMVKVAGFADDSPKA
jgi:hypothetical protein